MLNPEYAGCFYWLDGRLDQAKDTFNKAYKRNSSVSAALCVAMIADDEKDAVGRDALLREITTTHSAKAPRSAAICKLFVETAFDRERKKPVDATALGKLVEGIPWKEEAARACSSVGFSKTKAISRTQRSICKSALNQHALIWYRYLADGAIKRLNGE